MCRVGRQRAVVLSFHGHLVCEAVQIARARVVPKPVPLFKHAIDRCIGHVSERRKPFQECAVKVDHARHLRLLQHELRHQHVVRVARSAPREVTGILAVPATKPHTKQA